VTHLADVNVLLALLWPRHEGHRAAHTWFAKTGARAWATNSLTQLGVLRLLTNPAVTQAAVSAHAALALLADASRHEGHEFWPLDGNLLDGLQGWAARIHGHRQWTAAALLRHAEERGGVLVTFDSGMKELAGDGAARRVLVLRAV
jgi:toxin-antitoxin system PIN domain toxin